MQPKSIKNSKNSKANSVIEVVQWPTNSSTFKQNVDEKIFAIQTTRTAPTELFYDKNSPYQGFNLGLHVGDCAKNVEENRNYLQTLSPPNSKIQWLEQVHGNEVVEISKVSNKPIIADAVVTREKNTCLAIMTADCLPILLVSKKGDEIAAIHGGWRPLAANIITNTIEKMNTPSMDIYAWLGPCISKKAFEVGSEVKGQFIEKNDSFNSAFSKKDNGQYLADLHKIAKLQLESLGINQISMLPECTYSNTNKYYSYRKNSVTGRMASLICIR